MAENFSNAYQTLLSAPIADGVATAISVTSGVGAPAPNFRIEIDNELMLVTSVGAGTNWTVQRGIEGTAAVAHVAASPVVHVVTTGGFAQYITDKLTGATVAASFASLTVAGALVFTGLIGYMKANGAGAVTAAASVPWGDLSTVPTTLAGYGITDAYTKAAADARYAPIAVPWGTITGTPTTLGGYGITDAYTKAAADARYAPIAVPWGTITGTPTTLAGYGITDAYTKAAADARYAPIAVPWGTITGTPTTATGYGIASIDAVPIGATTASTIVGTSIRGTGAAIGGVTTGFYSSIAAAAGTYAYYSAGSAQILFVGLVGIGSTNAADPTNLNGTQLIICGGGTHSATTTQLFGVRINTIVPATGTVGLTGHDSTLQTTNTGFTCGELVHFDARITTRGAASTLNNSYGYRVRNGIASATNNYGFWSDINSATTTYQLFMGGTALNLLKGGVILDTTAAPTVGVGQVGLGATVAGTASAGAGGALPATVESYWILNIAGTARKIPYYPV